MSPGHRIFRGEGPCFEGMLSRFPSIYPPGKQQAGQNQPGYTS
jgi:hypothetical protein